MIHADPRHLTSPRRGFSRVEAAVYVGVSPTTFDKLVSEHSMPSPIRIRARRVWDVRALDLAFDALSGEDASVNPWDAQ